MRQEQELHLTQQLLPFIRSSLQVINQIGSLMPRCDDDDDDGNDGDGDDEMMVKMKS